MTAKILDGRALAEKIKAEIKADIAERRKEERSIPGLAVILVGDDPASQHYVAHKKRACEEVGIYSVIARLPVDVTQEQLIAHIDQYNQDSQIHGILLQLPLPPSLDTTTLLERISPQKDVDGFHPYNFGRLAQRHPLLRPCTPYGVMQLLHTTQKTLKGKHAVVIGASNIVGRPMALELLLAKCTVTVCHRFTHNLADQVKQADILVAAIGKPGVIQSAWIKPNSIVIDVGFNRLPDGHIVGDIDFNTAKEKSDWITPVPGGVGPMTVATLLKNTLLAQSLQ